MARSFSAQDLIQLPALSAEDTVALATELVTTAKAAGKLPASVADALEDLDTGRGVLLTELQKRGAGELVDPKRARVADAAIDGAWGSFARWLSAWAALDGTQGDAPRAIYARLFPDGLTFLSKKYKAEWAESEARLQVIAQEKIDATIDGLGGKPFLKALRQAHDAYGKALGITDAKPEAAPPPNVKEARENVLVVMREYVAQVAATARHKKPETQVLATKLLGPIATWEATHRSSPAVPGPGPAPAPGSAPN